jgi:ferredoxin
MLCQQLGEGTAMKIEVDKDLCQAYGNCLLAAPEVFSLDEASAVVDVLMSHPPEGIREEVEEAIRSCPVEALSVVES